VTLAVITQCDICVNWLKKLKSCWLQGLTKRGFSCWLENVIPAG